MKNITKFRKILALVSIAIILIIVGFLIFNKDSNNNEHLSQRNNPTPISVDVHPVDESMLPPKMTQEYMEKEIEARAKKLLGESLTEVSGTGTLTIPFTLGEEIEVLPSGEYSFNEWVTQSTFIFTEYESGPCAFFCIGEKFLYNIDTKTRIPIIEDDEWTVSPDGQFAVGYEQGTVKDPSESLGVFRIKNIQSGETRDLGRAIKNTGRDGLYTGSCLWSFAWSADNQNIAMLDWCNYDSEAKGPAVEVLSLNAKNISERRLIGHTRYREIERPKNGKLIFWSPDNTKIYVKDSYTVFDIMSEEELYRPKEDSVVLSSWSPDSKKIIEVAYNLGFAVVNTEEGTTDGYLFTKLPMAIKPQDLAWMPDSRHILVSDWGYGRKGYIYYINIENQTFGRITETEVDHPYQSIEVSPLGNYLVYLYEGKLMMRSINYKN